METRQILDQVLDVMAAHRTLLSVCGRPLPEVEDRAENVSDAAEVLDAEGTE